MSYWLVEISGRFEVVCGKVDCFGVSSHKRNGVLANCLITYSVADAISVITVHEQRHIQQAEERLALIIQWLLPHLIFAFFQPIQSFIIMKKITFLSPLLLIMLLNTLPAQDLMSMGEMTDFWNSTWLTVTINSKDGGTKTEKVEASAENYLEVLGIKSNVGEYHRDGTYAEYYIGKADTVIYQPSGNFLDNQDLRDIFILKVNSLEEAKKITGTDPAVMAGQLRMEVKPWYGPAKLMDVLGTKH